MKLLPGKDRQSHGRAGPRQVSTNDKTLYINTFIIPVMVFNLIKWSAISIISGITQVKIPSRYLNRNDTTIFKESYKINNEKEKEDEYAIE